jgi:hypothetical protein
MSTNTSPAQMIPPRVAFVSFASLLYLIIEGSASAKLFRILFLERQYFERADSLAEIEGRFKRNWALLALVYLLGFFIAMLLV